MVEVELTYAEIRLLIEALQTFSGKTYNESEQANDQYEKKVLVDRGSSLSDLKIKLENLLS